MIDLYSVATANGQRVEIALEELGLAYRRQLIDVAAGELRAPWYLGISPYGLAPAITDHDGPGGGVLHLSETLAIALYLAEKTGKLMPSSARQRIEVVQWLSLNAANFGPAMRAQFHFSAKPQSRRPEVSAHFEQQARWGLAVLDERMVDREWIAGGDYSMADVLWFPSIEISARRLGSDVLAEFPAIERWRRRVAARPAVQVAMGRR